MSKSTIAVIGSINMDMVTETTNFPKQGETVLGDSFKTFPGGKGANQAVAAARLGASVSMFGCVGDDAFGNVLLDALKHDHVNIDNVEPVTHINSGVATIIVSDHDNRIIVHQGANAHVTPDYIDRHLASILANDIVIVQLEIPVQTVEYILDRCHGKVPVIINPAPAQSLPLQTLEKATYLTPNETEYKQLFELNDTLTDKLIITLGSQGAAYYTSGEKIKVLGFQVNPLDTTGAGDTFNGAFAVKVAEGATLKEAIRFANAAAALSIQQLGAQTGMPSRESVESFIRMNEENVT
ncbi:ribokinase [Paenalkalicoccus suaedae]|uniref:Ribokinase n=1 Tax=Paenalkalicoccus suaedae TaxID=2592382 RepID=A0A859FHF5_9BACI|nr:ribokinase [Paenalkalicoccus suaedae]QKS72549.1 ribokinase [Paenalkalicoccus suaedae]